MLPKDNIKPKEKHFIALVRLQVSILEGCGI
jgi:hypothetical protein